MQRSLDALRLLDEMPLERNGKKPLVPSSRDGIDSLPYGMLEHILGFLEAQGAVGTCMLAKRWHHLWKSATVMRVISVSDCWIELTALKKFRQFVDCLLDSRGYTPLEACELSFNGFYIHDQDMVDFKLCLNRWIRHVVLCQVQMLKLHNLWYLDFEPDDLPLVSRHLTRLELGGVDLNSSFCDFSSCPSLQHLEIANCYLCHAKKISSEALKCLSITNCIFSKEFCTLIDVALLVSLRLDGHLYMAPVLQGMSALQEAYVGVQRADYHSGCSYEDCYSCYGIVQGEKMSVLLDNLSVAENLALICESKTV